MSRSNIDGAAKLGSSVVWYTALIWYDTLAYVCLYLTRTRFSKIYFIIYAIKQMSRSNIDGAAKLRSSVVWYTALIWYDTLAYVFMCCYMDS